MRIKYEERERPLEAEALGSRTARSELAAAAAAAEGRQSRLRGAILGFDEVKIGTW